MAQSKVAEEQRKAEAANRAILEALDAGQVDRAMTFVADDAVLLVTPSVDGTGVFIGKEQIRGWYQLYVAGHSTVRPTEVHWHGGRGAFTADVAADLFRSQGRDWAPHYCVTIYQGGLLRFGLWVAVEEAMTQPADPESVMRRLLTLVQAGKVDEALSFVAEDAVITLIPPPAGMSGVFIGKEQIRGWWKAYFAMRGAVEYSDFSSYGPCATWSATVATDDFRKLGLDWVEADAVAIIEGGLLRGYSYVFTERGLARLEAARSA